MTKTDCICITHVQAYTHHLAYASRRTQACMHARTHTHTHTHTHTLHRCACKHAAIYLHLTPSVYILHLCKHVHACTCVCVHAWSWICVCNQGQNYFDITNILRTPNWYSDRAKSDYCPKCMHTHMQAFMWSQTNIHIPFIISNAWQMPGELCVFSSSRIFAGQHLKEHAIYSRNRMGGERDFLLLREFLNCSLCHFYSYYCVTLVSKPGTKCGIHNIHTVSFFVKCFCGHCLSVWLYSLKWLKQQAAKYPSCFALLRSSSP